MTTTEAFNSPVPTPVQHSAWHSPVPYLFGGLAAMLGLIAFALLILACSYWKLSGYLENGNGDGSADPDLETGETNSDEKVKPQPVWEEKILVIMAGQAKPTFLATPISSRASSFGSNSSSGEKTEEESEKPKQGSDDPVQERNMVNRETSDQVP
ncbi:protein GLUTAMINE DUMPER 3-like [Cornus florida]|uniref:protein GLUTAMINE DUMPER 3-like n=1 Tax=Cornus florida TaxID=4283 RepID=UPI002899741A|nr:protein GLUTAMINE DUMPER 3-like [Cornus florida]